VGADFIEGPIEGAPVDFDDGDRDGGVVERTVGADVLVGAGVGAGDFDGTAVGFRVADGTFVGL
jgi:hypothetical protein